MLKGRPLANRHCMYCCDRELVNDLLFQCPVTHSLWTFMLQAFGIHWVMPRSVAGCYLVGISGLGSIIWTFGTWFQGA